jgi:predicted nucleic-acid-binding protein
MIGIDTNIRVRMIVADSPRQVAAARDFIRHHCTADEPGLVSNVALAELTWTLARTYGCSREQVAMAIEQILETVQLQVESAADVSEALRHYRAGSADFSDCLIAQSCRSAGCDYTITFDRKAAKVPGFKLVPT